MVDSPVEQKENGAGKPENNEEEMKDKGGFLMDNSALVLGKLG